jgi:type II secretory pathway pseudopilin PulG
LKEFVLTTTRNEQRLLLVLITIVVASGTFYGYRWLSQRQTAQQTALAELQADQAEAQVDLQDAGKFAQRKSWIDANEPPLVDVGDAKTQLQDYIEKGVTAHKLAIVVQSIDDPQVGAAGTRIGVSITVKGPMQALCEWLTEFQKPDQFYAVTSLTMTADPDQKSMVCKLQLARYYKHG